MSLQINMFAKNIMWSYLSRPIMRKFFLSGRSLSPSFVEVQIYKACLHTVPWILINFTVKRYNSLRRNRDPCLLHSWLHQKKEPSPNDRWLVGLLCLQPSTRLNNRKEVCAHHSLWSCTCLISTHVLFMEGIGSCLIFNSANEVAER